MDFLLYFSYVGALYGLLKVIYDMYKSKKWVVIRKSHEFVILIISVIVATCFSIPWSKIHYGDEKPKIIYVQLPVKKEGLFKKSPEKNLKETTDVPHQMFKPKLVHKGAIETKKIADTPKSTSKYDLSHAQLSQSAVGDHASVTNYGKPQRHYEENERKIKITLQSMSIDTLVIDFDMGNPEEKILAMETYNALKQQKYKLTWLAIMYGGIPPQSTNGDDFTIDKDKKGVLHLVVMAK
ncbi:hypothetical protein [Mucilaginibacter sp.]|uniref:hypothetical protein n=1 Tax=Mucilaginibacter sp. TaxID=1882438 RepID=UPI0026069753|nr:hypothetical protein [Mucilaginibacter sp.]MDB5032578.1 hypothetical protein [Mucilaginibacter sp.]